MLSRIIRSILLIFVLLSSIGAVAQSSQQTLREEILRAEELFERGRWADARHAWIGIERELSENQLPERELAAYYLAVCAVELGRPDAETALLRFEERFPGSLRTNDVRFARASHYCTTGEYEKALETFEKINYRALSADNRNKYDIRRGYLDFAAGDYEKAYSYFERVDKKSAYADHALYYRSYIDYTKGDYTKAKAGFEELTKSHTYQSIAPFYLLQLEFREENYTYVTTNGDKLIPTATPAQQNDLRRMIAEAWFHLDNYAKAYEYIAAYHQNGGESTREAAYIEGFSLYRLAQYQNATEGLRRAAGPADALTQNAAYHLADCYLRLEEKQSAMQAFAMATDKSLSAEIAEDALFNYGKLQYELGGGRFNEAINVLSRYRTEYPKSERLEEVNALLAAAYYNSENYDAAYEAIRTLPSPDSDMRAAHQKITFYRALKHYEAGDLTGADEGLKEAAEIGVSARYKALSDFWRGEIACARGNYAAAQPLFERYLQQAPRTEREYALAHYNLGYCHLRNQREAEAERSFTQFLSLYSTADDLRADALNREGDSRYEQRHFEEALKSYEAAAATTSTARHYGAYQRAITLGILGRSEAKIEGLKSIIATNKGDWVDDASYELGHSYMAQKRYREAATVLKDFVEHYPNSPAYSAALSDLGVIYANLGDKAQSMAYYDRVVKASPSSAEGRTALQGIRELYLAEGDAEGYFAYAKKSGMESDLSQHTRDSLSFAAAQSLYLANRSEDAARSLRSYLKSFPKGAYRSDALYFISNCYHELKDSKRELNALQELTQEGTNTYTTEALARLAPMAYSSKEYRVAADAYGRLMTLAANSEERNLAAEGFVRATVSTGDEEAILKMAREIEAQEELSEKALREARFAHALVCDQRGEKREAQALYDLLRREVRSPEGAEAMYRTILARMDAGKWKEVEELVFAFSEMPSAHNYWLAKSFLTLGDCYLKQGDSFQARATWQSVADGYSPADDGIIREAKARINQLKN